MDIELPEVAWFDSWEKYCFFHRNQRRFAHWPCDTDSECVTPGVSGMLLGIIEIKGDGEQLKNDAITD